MYKFLSISDFAKKGINSDYMPWDLDPSYLTEMNNIRITNNKLVPFGGKTVWTDLPVNFDCGYIIFVRGLNGNFWLVAGTNAVYSWNGTSFSDVSNALGYGGVSNPDLWSGCLMGNVPILNNPGSYPEYWSPQNVAQPMLDLPWDASNSWRDVGETCKIMRSHKQFLFALDLEGTTIGEMTDGVRWSSPADNGSLPETWDPLDTSSTSALVRLGGVGGRIIDGLSLRDSFVVYREGAIHVFDFVGGQFVFRIRNFTNTVGAIAPDSIVEVRGKHYMIGGLDIWVNDGNSIHSILKNRLRKRFADTVDPDNFLNSYSINVDSAKEVWFCVPSTGSTYADTAYIYNHEEDTWTIRDIPQGPYASYGAQSEAQITWTTIIGTWETVSGTWGDNQSSPLDDTVVLATKNTGAGTSGQLLFLDKKGTISDTTYDAVIERTGFALEGLQNVTTITKVYPRMSGSGTCFVEIGSQDYPGSPIRWKQAVLFTPEFDRKVDIRSTGELHCFRFYSPQNIGNWEISGMDIEYVNAGAR
jgi:hypothetical protein